MSVPYNAIVRFQYDPDPENASDDLQLTVDETITVTEVIDDEWLFGSKQLADGTTSSGYFPRSFVAEIAKTEEQAGLQASLTESETTPDVPELHQEEHKDGPSAALESIESNIVHEPENFKNKLQSFNVSSTPIMPQEKRNEETFVKKSFNGIEHRSSYVPPTFGTSNQPKKEEKKPVVGEVVRSETQVEEDVVPKISVKERMLLLQKQQAEQEAMLAAAMKRLEEKKKKTKRSHETAPATEVAETEGMTAESVGAEDNSTIERDHSNEYLDAENGGDNDDGVNVHVGADSEQDEEEDREDNDDNDEDDDDDDEEEEEEEDEEEIRKRELAQRMAKLSGGIGMMGMMGMMPSPLLNKSTKKAKKKENKEEEAELEEPSKPVPILPMMGAAPPIMGMPLPPQSPTGDSNEEEEEEVDPGNEETIAETKYDNLEKELEDSSEEEPAPSAVVVEQTTPSHPYRTHAAPPPPPAASLPPAVPTSTMHSALAAPPPPPPVTQMPDDELNPFPEPPSVPTGLPPSMPQTVHPAERPPMPPPPTRTTKGAPPPPPVPGAVPSVHIPTATMTTAPPPPVPGAVPSVHIPTVAMTAPPPVPGAVPAVPAVSTTHFQPHPFAPSAPPPVPGDFPVAHTQDTVSRKSSVASRPPNFHAPPPPPPAPAAAAAEGSTPAPPVINRQLTRTSLESTMSTPLPPTSVSPTSNSMLWWTTGSLPPQLSTPESLFEVETTEIKKRNGDVVRYLIYYILDVHLACTTLELAYHVSEPERILFFHESKEKTKSDPEQLLREYTEFGAHTYNAALKLLGQNVGSTFIDCVFTGVPGPVLPPIADKTFGAVVYRNNNGDSKFYEEIRPGDILVLVKATFESSSGVQNVGFDRPHVAVVTSFESEKEKIKVLEEANGVVHQARYRLNKMKSGKLRVFRVVGRSFVGW